MRRNITRKRITISIVLTLLVVVMISTAAALGSNGRIEDSITVGGAVLRIDKVEEYDIVGGLFVENVQEMTERRVRYVDENDNMYIFHDTDLIAYRATASDYDDIVSLVRDSCLLAVSEALKPLIRGYENFSITNFDEALGGYRLLMHNSISEYVQDTLTVQVDIDGIISWFVVDYSNLTMVSNEQVRVAHELLSNYIRDNSEDHIYHINDLQFRLKGECTIASFIVRFESADGYSFVRALSFVV